MSKKLHIAIMGFLLAFATTDAVGICKWVDKNGVTHFAETCPDESTASEVQIQPPPPQEQVEEAIRSSEQLLKQKRKKQPSNIRSLPLSELGPLPENSHSEYLTTMGTGVNMDTATLTGQFSIHLKTGPRLPEDAYIEVHFPNPANPANTDVVVEGIETGKSGLMFLSSKSKAFKCWNYEVTVYVYRDNSMSKLLGSHHQVIQSRFDLDKVKTRKELARALFEGNCPTTNEDKPKTVKQWEALCEREREKRIAPLRKAQIKKCITEKKDKRWCETYWSSYGDSRRVGTYLRSPRLFDDLPECIQARKVRE